MTDTTAARRAVDAPIAADEVAEFVRRLNYALQDAAARGDFPMSPTDAYRITGALAAAARRLPQALHETASVVCEPEGLRVDDGTDPFKHLARVCAAFHDAQQHARALEAALENAWRLLGSVAYASPRDLT
ncbi:hypothetical protein [Streptodolium elevatio]